MQFLHALCAVQERGSLSSAACGTVEGQNWSYSRNPSPPCLTHPKAGLLQSGKWLCWEYYFQCIQKKHLSLKLQRFLPYLGCLMQKIMISGSWLPTRSCVTNPSLLRGKELKITSHRTIMDTNNFVKSRNTQRFYKILSRHWNTLTKRNHLSTSLIRQGKKPTTLQLTTLWKWVCCVWIHWCLRETKLVMFMFIILSVKQIAE